MSSERDMERCELLAQVQRYCDGELPAEQSAALEKHLVTCAVCAAELKSLREVSAFVGSYEAPALSAARLTRMRRAVQQAAERQSLDKVALRLVGLAACLAVAGIVWNAALPQTVAAPAAWEGAATNLSDESTQGGNRELALAEFMVTDLSADQAGGAGLAGGGASHE